MDKASITVTTQAAEKVYRAIHESAQITTTLRACDSAKLAWLPQETIVFNRARVCRRTQIEVSSGAELLALEWLVLGRAAHGEKISAGEITDSWRVMKDGRLIWPTAFALPMTFFHIFLGRHCCRTAQPSQHCCVSGLTSTSVCSFCATWLLRSSVSARRRWLVGWWSFASLRRSPAI